MLKRFLSPLAAACLLQVGFVQAADETARDARPEVGLYVKGYAGAEGVKVWTTRIGPESRHEALFQVGGVDHAWARRILKVKVESSGLSDKYVAQVDGQPFVVMTVTNRFGELHLPKVVRPYEIAYSKELSEQGNPEQVLADYLKQGGK